MEVWDMMVWYFSQLWLSFYATVIAPRPMGVMTAPLVMVLCLFLFLWLIHKIIRVYKGWRWRSAVIAMGKLRVRFMSPAERAKYLSYLMEQAIERELELFFVLGDITDDERAWLYREFATKMGYAGLVRCYKEHLKRELIERRAKGEKVGMYDMVNPAFAANRAKMLSDQQTKGIKKAETLLEMLGEEPKSETLEGILDGK